MAGASRAEIEMRKKRFAAPTAFKITMESFCRNIFRTITHLLLILSIGTFGKVGVVFVPK